MKRRSPPPCSNFSKVKKDQEITERIFRSILYRGGRLGILPRGYDQRWPDTTSSLAATFDHGDAVATWPRTVNVIKQMKNLGDTDKEKVLGGNAMKMLD